MTRQCSIGQQPTGAIFYIVSKNDYLSFHCRQDSTIVTPYESWQYYDPSVVSKPQNQNYAGNKSKKVAWFVSNCGARNGRLQYAQELSKYIRHHPAITLWWTQQPKEHYSVSISHNFLITSDGSDFLAIAGSLSVLIFMGRAEVSNAHGATKTIVSRC